MEWLAKEEDQCFLTKWHKCGVGLITYWALYLQFPSSLFSTYFPLDCLQISTKIIMSIADDDQHPYSLRSNIWLHTWICILPTCKTNSGKGVGLVIGGYSLEHLQSPYVCQFLQTSNTPVATWHPSVRSLSLQLWGVEKQRKGSLTVNNK